MRVNEQWLDQPLRWKKPRKIFVVAHGDLFAEQVPDEWIDRVFAVMALAPQHIFQVLTKRPERMRAYLTDRSGKLARFMIDEYIAKAPDSAPKGKAINVAWPVRSVGDIDWPSDVEMRSWPLPNLWLGVSIEDQKRADERREPMQLLADIGWLTWVNYEPAIGPVTWNGWNFLRWIVSGGESGDRPTHPDWHRATRNFCAVHRNGAAGRLWAFDLDDCVSFLPDDERVPVIGLEDHERAQERMIWSDNERTPEGRGYLRVGKKAAGRLRSRSPPAATGKRSANITPTGQRPNGLWLGWSIILARTPGCATSTIAKWP